MEPFIQAAPILGNTYDTDRVLRTALRRLAGDALAARMAPSLRAMGELAGGELARLQAVDRLQVPTITHWDPWGTRIDAIEVSALWRRCETVAAEHGVVAAAYEPEFGPLARLHQFSLVHLFGPSSDVYTCPLAMTDGAARTLLATGNRALIARAVPRLTSRDPSVFWTSGQWMTESTGGSDVGLSRTVARPDGSGGHRLYGRKWFTSATTAQMALTLARTEGAPDGGRGLSLFYVETRDADGRLQGIRVNRLKDKLGTKKVPTAELDLEGVPATLVCGEGNGTRNIAPMLAVTRTWNAVSAASLMRRGLELARSYASKRFAFGALLAEKPLHLATLAPLAAETEAAFHLTFEVARRLGRVEAGEGDMEDELLLRVLTPIAKLTTGRQAVAVLAELIESFGGAGYVEDTGLPALLRDAHVLPIWEGTTNVLSLDVLRACASLGAVEDALERWLGALEAEVDDASMRTLFGAALAAIRRALGWLREASLAEPASLEAGARRFALTLGRSLELALIAVHGAYGLRADADPRSAHAARVFAIEPFDLLSRAIDRESASIVALDR